MEVTIPRRRFSALPPIKVEIGAEFANSPEGVKLGAAVKVWVGEAAKKGTHANLTHADLTGADLTRANLTRADLTHANLTGADLTGADLTGADMTHANLTGADLTHANLTRADLTHTNLTHANLTGADLTGAVPRPLRGIKADFFLVLLGAQAEVPGLIKALREGRVDGSTYHGECACLVGTIANVRKVSVNNLERDGSRPAERWFMGIRKGDTPATNQMAKIAEGWALEFCAMTGIDPEPKAEAA